MYTSPTVRTIRNIQQRRRGEKMRPHMDGSARRKWPGAPCGTAGSHRLRESRVEQFNRCLALLLLVVWQQRCRDETALDAHRSEISAACT